MRRVARTAPWALVALLGVFALPLAAPEAMAVERPQVSGTFRLSAGSIDAAPTFLDGGYGKLIAGDRPDDTQAGALVGESRLALDWEPSIGWRLFVHGVARLDPDSTEDAAGTGLLEAFVERRYGFGKGHEIAARLGQFFLPSSRENVEPLWASPYTLTLSALNSWIAEEIRPIGLDARWSKTFADGQQWLLAGTVFGGNDTSGTLIAWRGFALHDRPTPTFRRVPLPTLARLEAGFPDQDPRGTTPFEDDLDGRAGLAGRARWIAPAGRAVVQATAFLNDGDRDLHDLDYAWRTDFRWLSTEVELTRELRFLGEWGTGVSEMGFAPPGLGSGSAVEIELDALYAMLSWARGSTRVSLRYDDFRVDDLDQNPADDNREEGSAVTLAVMVSRGERWRFGAEVLSLESERAAATAAGSPALDGVSVRAELRFAF